MKQLKNLKYIEGIIKITRVREHFKEGNSHSFKDKLICVKIKKPNVIASTCFPATRKGERELIKSIKKELYFK